MKNALILFFPIVFFSCETKTHPEQGSHKKYIAGESIEETLKQHILYSVDGIDKAKLTVLDYYMDKFGSQAIESISVIEVDSIPGKNLVLVFYQFNLGANVVKRSLYMKELDGRWYLSSKYFSKYDDDPFGNGRAADGKALLEKKEKWDEQDNNLEIY